jgi:hypothetical protein
MAYIKGVVILQDRRDFHSTMDRRPRTRTGDSRQHMEHEKHLCRVAYNRWRRANVGRQRVQIGERLPAYRGALERRRELIASFSMSRLTSDNA